MFDRVYDQAMLELTAFSNPALDESAEMPYSRGRDEIRWPSVLWASRNAERRTNGIALEINKQFTDFVSLA